MTALLDQLRLEILATLDGNLMTNHSGQDGTTTGWTATNGALTALTGQTFGYGGKALNITDTATGAGASQWMESESIPIVGGQYLNAAVQLRANHGDIGLGVVFYNAANTILKSVSPSHNKVGDFYDVYGAYEIKSHNMDANFDGGYYEPLAPSGTTHARIVLQWFSDYAGTGPAQFWEVMVVKGTTRASVLGPVFSDTAETWQNILGGTITITTARGGDVTGVTDALAPGLLTATIDDPQVTPDNNERMRPGWPLRIRALVDDVWEPVYRGKIENARTNFNLAVPRVIVTAIDAISTLQNYTVPAGKSGRFKQRIDAAMLDVDLTYVVADTDSNTTSSLISVDSSGTALTQLETVRDSLRGLFYVDKTNLVQCFANNSYPSQTPVVTFSDDYADTGAIYFTEIDTAFDTKNLVNTLLITKANVNQPDGSKTYGPYVNQASVDAWGSVSATVDVNDGDPSTLAGAYLSTYADPTNFASSVRFRATENIAQAVGLELYQAAAVKFAKSNIDAVYRIISIEHEIDGYEWFVTVRFKPMESTTSITVTNPPGGANSGPQDLAPSDTGWVALTTLSPFTAQYGLALRRINGIVYQRGAYSRSSGYSTNYTNVTGPVDAKFRPSDTTLVGHQGNTIAGFSARMTASGYLQAYQSEASGAFTGVTASWPAGDYV